MLVRASTALALVAVFAGWTARVEAVTGRTDAPGAVCEPFMMAHYDRAQRAVTAIIESPAFRECVADRMGERYIACANLSTPEPLQRSSLASQIQGVFAVLREGNHVRLNCDPRGSDSAHLQGWGTDTLRAMNVGQGWPRWAWDTGYIPTGGDVGDSMATLVHEFSHTHDYQHMVWDCAFRRGDSPDGCALAACSWTTVCGGSGVAPTGTYSWADPDARNRCAFHAGLGDDHYPFTDPSVPYILSDCVAALVGAADSTCGGWSSTSCPAGEIRVPGGYDEATNTYTAACACVPEQRHRVGLRSGTGGFFQASGGSAQGELRAQGPGMGAWETFWIIDRNGGYLLHGDEISIRSNVSDLFVRVQGARASVRVDGASDDIVPFGDTRFFIERQLGLGRVANNDVVFLRSRSRGTYLTAVGDGGGQIVSDAVAARDWETFTFVAPSRVSLVHLLSAAANIAVEFSPSSNGQLFVSLSPAPLDCEPSAIDGSGCSAAYANDGAPAARRQSFWLWDHNGGALSTGDLVSFEGSHENGPTFISTCTSGTGNVRGDDWYPRDCSSFRIWRADGTAGEIRHGEKVALQAVHGRFLRFFGGRLRADLATRPAAGAGVFTFQLTQGRRSDGALRFSSY